MRRQLTVRGWVGRVCAPVLTDVTGAWQVMETKSSKTLLARDYYNLPYCVPAGGVEEVCAGARGAGGVWLLCAGTPRGGAPCGPRM